MALTATSLASAATAGTLNYNVTSATGATVDGFIRVDGEFAYITVINGTQISVRGRGTFGTTAVAHGVLAPVVYGLNSDLSALGMLEQLPVPVSESDLVGVGANGVITVPNRNTTHLIMKGSALASSTFADPSASQDGLEVTFVGGTDFAHVVTTVSVNDGTSGLHTTLTSAAFAGSTLTLVAFKTKWMVKSNNLWVIT